jgi:hypothetical protein
MTENDMCLSRGAKRIVSHLSRCLALP